MNGPAPALHIARSQVLECTTLAEIHARLEEVRARLMLLDVFRGVTLTVDAGPDDSAPATATVHVRVEEKSWYRARGGVQIGVSSDAGPGGTGEVCLQDCALRVMLQRRC